MTNEKKRENKKKFLTFILSMTNDKWQMANGKKERKMKFLTLIPAMTNEK